MTTASIIIATYNRADLLDECLAHLARQQFAPGDQVLIADNGSTDHTARVVAQRVPGFPVPLVRVYEPTPGKSIRPRLSVTGPRFDTLGPLSNAPVSRRSTNMLAP